jgi:hypothetical protein
MATNEDLFEDTTAGTPVAAETSSTTLPAGSSETALSRTQRAKQGLKNAAKDKKKVAIASAAAVAVAGAAAGLLTRSRRKSSAAAEGDGSPGLYASPEISTGTGVEDRTLKAAEKARKKEEKEKKKAAGKESKKSKSH